ncbi:MAG: TonB-dependent receptor [Pseudomonadota bacterium]
MIPTNSKCTEITALIMLCAGASLSTDIMAQEGAGSRLDEVVVTARQRTESLQEVPDAVTAFDAEKIERVGINSFESYVNQTPNFFSRQGFRAGVVFVTIRGITTGQQGFPPISYTVDGVKAGMLDSVNPGTLFDLERIEVLRGPQGALYGNGAIAGAVNIITKAPGDTLGGEVRVGYAEGNDLTLQGTVSGPLIEDKVAFRLSGFVRDTDGLIDSTSGADIDFVDQKSFRGQLLITPTEKLSIDLRASVSDINAGAAMQERFETLDQLNSFSGGDFSVERGILGEENRESTDISAKIDIELPFATLTSVTSYTTLDQDLFGSASWARPPAAGEPPVGSIFGPILGDNAAAGEPIDNFQDLADNFEVFFQDLRLTSSGDGAVRWIVGAEILRRETENNLDVGLLLAPQPGALASIFGRFDDKEDDIFGVYGQVNIDLSDAWELTLAGRYDENDYDTRQFDPATGATIQNVDANGVLVDKLTASDSKFQPKVQLSYDWSDELMTYFTYARGFRFGFFNTGNLTRPETTDNFEFGFKSTLADQRVSLNGAVFVIDYSDQQQSVILPTPPFRTTNNIPSTDIQGIELEFQWAASEHWDFSGGFGYLDAEINELDVRPDGVPELTANLAAQYTMTLGSGHDLFVRADWRHQGDFVINDGPILFDIDSVDFFNARIGVEGDHWMASVFVRNLTDEQFASDPGFLGFFIRQYSLPRQAGAEFRYRFGN